MNGSSSEETNASDREGATSAFYFFVGTLALSLLALLGSLIFM
jgi:hypothetical protein